MPFYYYIFLFILALIILVVILFLVNIRKNACDLLFMEGLKEENLKHLHEAVVIYEEALLQTGKIKFKRNFKHKIISKIKVLHTMIAYEGTFRKNDLPVYVVKS